MEKCVQKQWSDALEADGVGGWGKLLKELLLVQVENLTSVSPPGRGPRRCPARWTGGRTDPVPPLRTTLSPAGGAK